MGQVILHIIYYLKQCWTIIHSFFWETNTHIGERKMISNIKTYHNFIYCRNVVCYLNRLRLVKCKMEPFGVIRNLYICMKIWLPHALQWHLTFSIHILFSFLSLLAVSYQQVHRTKRISAYRLGPHLYAFTLSVT